jgi:hypothetical protein
MADTEIINVLVQSIAKCNTYQKIGDPVIVDVNDPNTWPTEPVAPHKKHCLIDDDDGNIDWGL